MTRVSDPVDEVTEAEAPEGVAGGLAVVAEHGTAETDPAATEDETPAAGDPVKLFLHYSRYLGLFVGAGLLAGAIVHFPLAPFRYTVMGVVGAAIFAGASVSEDLAGRSRNAQVRWLAASLALAISVGMVAGGIQHFEDFPQRAAVLIPLGLLMGLVAFAVRDGHRLAQPQMLQVAAVAVVTIGVLGLSLDRMVSSSSADGHGHAHGGTEKAEVKASHGSEGAHGEETEHGKEAAHEPEAHGSEPDTSHEPEVEAAKAKATSKAKGRAKAKAKAKPRPASSKASGTVSDDELVAAVQALEERYAPSP